MKYSEIIRRSLEDVGGQVTLYSLSGKPIIVKVMGKGFWSDKLFPNSSNCYDFEIFDVIQSRVNVLKGTDSEAKVNKGQARNYRLGHIKNNYDTLTGTLGYDYFHKEDGDYIFDPIFVLVAIMDFAGIGKNRRGYFVFSK